MSEAAELNPAEAAAVLSWEELRGCLDDGS
jgi:hypothetical protein